MESKNIFDIEIENVLQTLNNGGVFLYPTDTIWGIGCDASNQDAIQKIYKIKQREESKALISLVSDTNMLFKYTNHIPKFNISAQPTTVIYPNVKGLSKNLLPKDGSAAIRISSDEFCFKLIQKLNGAIVSTSANISGEKSPKQFSDISTHIKNNADYIVNLRQDERMETPSSILKIETDGKITKLR